MTEQQDIITARAKGHSRKHIADLSGLTESVIWRIETKGTIKSNEVAALRDILPGLANRVDAPTEDGPALTEHVHGGRPAPGDVPGATSTDRPSEPAVAATQSSSELPSTNGNTVHQGLDSATAEEDRPAPDWSVLQRLAMQVGDHEIERHTLGPNPTTARLFSNSEIQTFKDCRRKWWLGWYRGMTPKAESPVGALAIGDRVHRALKCWYAPEGQERINPVDALEMLIINDWTRISTLLADEPLKLDSLRKQFDTEANLERAMIEGYMQWLAETGADSDFRVVEAETYVEVELRDDGLWFDGRPIKLIGKLDVKVYRIVDGMKMFIDHKTVQNFIQPRLLVGMSEQLLHYMLIEFLSNADGEARCDAALYNMLRKVKRTATAKPPFYDRVEVKHNNIAIQSYKTRVLGTIRDIYEVERALSVGATHLSVAYPRPSETCSWKCQFVSVCTMFDDGSRAEDMLKMYFRQHDPLAYYQNTEE